MCYLRRASPNENKHKLKLNWLPRCKSFLFLFIPNTETLTVKKTFTHWMRRVIDLFSFVIFLTITKCFCLFDYSWHVVPICQEQECKIWNFKCCFVSLNIKYLSSIFFPFCLISVTKDYFPPRLQFSNPEENTTTQSKHKRRKLKVPTGLCEVIKSLNPLMCSSQTEAPAVWCTCWESKAHRNIGKSWESYRQK